jgi:hypothetical protein
MSQQYDENDEQFGWKCVYPYSESNCDRIISSWSSDHDTPRQSIVDGLECSNCEPNYFVDDLERKHFLYAKCLNMNGASLTAADVQAPITMFKEGATSDVGWSVESWEFRACFDTWKCCEYCSLDANPPTCLVYQLSGWGTHVPVQGQACGYGSTPEIAPQPAPTSGSNTEPPPPRQPWFPIY